MGSLLGEEPGFLTDGAALRRVVGAVYHSGIGVDDVLERTKGGAGGVDIVSGRIVDFGIFDLLAGEQVLELIPRGGRLGRRRLLFLALGIGSMFLLLVRLLRQES